MSRYARVRRILLSLLCVASLVGCGDDEAITGPGGAAGEVIPFDGAVADVGFDAGIIEVDAGASEADVDPTDGAGGTQDAGVIDTGSSSMDTGPKHPPAPVDAGPQDTGPPPPDPALCALKKSQFLGIQAEALKCDTPFQCTKLAPKAMACPCERYYSTRTFAYQNLADISNEAKKMGCKGDCPDGPCPNMDVLVGVCKVGGCIDYDATCKELDEFATLALAEGVKCKLDSECVFAANNDLKCGCSQFYNLKTVGPGKPLFWYMMMLVKAYTAKGCGKNFQCACPMPKSAKCVAGVCATKF